MTKKKQSETKEDKKFHQELLRQMLTLSTSGFGLVAALAWNEAIKNLVQNYIDEFLPASSGVLSRFLYAIIITTLAVFVTYQLSRLVVRFNIPKH